MKETVTVNIGSEAFTLDDDACRTLRCYLDDIRSRLPEDDTETMGDIERRIAEIFRERVSSPMRVITLDVVRATMTQMGTPAAFGEPRRDAAAGTAIPRRKRTKRPPRANSTARGPNARSQESAADWANTSTPTRR